MAIEAVGGIGITQGNAVSKTVEGSLQQVTSELNYADRLAQNYLVGNTDSLHQVMMAQTEAKLSFDLLVQIRNQLIESYKTVMNMQL